MKWKANAKPEIGDERIIKRFLLLPRFVGDTWYWLELIKIKQIFASDYEWEHAIGAVPIEYWVDVEVINEKAI